MAFESTWWAMGPGNTAPFAGSTLGDWVLCRVKIAAITATRAMPGIALIRLTNDGFRFLIDRCAETGRIGSGRFHRTVIEQESDHLFGKPVGCLPVV